MFRYLIIFAIMTLLVQIKRFTKLEIIYRIRGGVVLADGYVHKSNSTPPNYNEYRMAWESG